MAKKDRTGNRKSREQRKQFKLPELGYYLTDCYRYRSYRALFLYRTSSGFAGGC